MQKELTTFSGYPPPTSSTTYTPNQFFDVVLPNSSRGVVRIVGYMLRRILGWSDADGNPVNPQLSFTYSELIERAGVSRSMIKDALDDASAKNFIRCIREPRPKAAGQNAISGLYELAWDDRETYTRSIEDFRGFYSGNGNLTYIPNKFFDFTVPNESLAVVKVVGAIIRYTIGFQSRHGMRRQRVQMSFSMLQRVTGITSRTLLSESLQESLSKKHIVRVKEGYFNPGAADGDATAVYAIRWQDEAASSGDTTRKIEESEVEKFFGQNKSGRNMDRLGLSSREVYQGGTEAAKDSSRNIGMKTAPELEVASVRKVDQAKAEERFEKRTRNGKKSAPASVRKGDQERLEKRTSIEITILNNNNNKPVAAVSETSESQKKLLEAGFDEAVATELSERFPSEQILRQITAFPNRRAKTNPLGLLRRAIEEDWASPTPPKAESRGEEKHPARVVVGTQISEAVNPEYEEFISEEAKRIDREQPKLRAEFEKEDETVRARLAGSTLVSGPFAQQILASYDSASSKNKRWEEFLVKKRAISSVSKWRNSAVNS